MRLSALVVLLGVLAVAGCGRSSGGPAVDRTVAADLARRADAVASAPGSCAARDRAVALQRRTIAAINAGAIPVDYQETLQARVNEIVTELEVRCLPKPTPAAAPPPPAPTPAATPGPDRRGHGKGHDKGHDKGHEKHDKHGKHDTHGKDD